MDRIICSVSMFVNQFTMIKVKEDGTNEVIGKISPEEFENTLLNYCYDNNLTTVRLIGDKKYAQGVKEKILMVNETKYNNRKKINIEV